MIRLFVVVNDEVLRVEISLLIQSRFDMKLEGWASNGSNAVAELVRIKPDIALIEAALPDFSGFELSRRLLVEAPSVRRVIVTDTVDAAAYSEAISTCICGFVIKTRAEQTLLKTLRGVERQGFFWDIDALANLV